jgi:hypothetical protein
MSMLRQSGSATTERELTEAVRRVHERYGSDLRSFFRDVQEEKAKSGQEPNPEPQSDDSTAA